MSKYEALRLRKPGLSLRKFAFTIGISPSNLSDVLKGRCGLSSENAIKIASNLKLSSIEQKRFLDLVASRHARSRVERDAAKKRIAKQEARPLKDDAEGSEIHSISKWYYMAALELVTLTKGQLTPDDLSKRLSISADEAAAALETLQKLGLISRAKGRYIRTKNHLVVQSAVPSLIVRKYHEQILLRARDALFTKPMPERKLSSTVFTFDSKRRDEVIEFLEEVDDELYRRFETDESADSVQCFSYQFFRLDNSLDTLLNTSATDSAT